VKTLVLNASMEFLGVVSWKQAVADAIAGNCIVIEEYDKVIRSERMTMKVPAVIQERVYVNVRWENIFKVSYSPTNVFIRDNYECQYCLKPLRRSRPSQEDQLALAKKGKLDAIMRELPEIDHVKPQSQGGKDTWSNTVCACRSCNSFKVDLTLKEAGMSLKSIPKKPTNMERILKMKLRTINERWIPYLEHYWD